MTNKNEQQQARIDGIAVDPRPGFYYVSVIDGDRKALIRGPFATHREALDRVADTRATAEDVDARAHFYAWGTARCDVDNGPGVLDRWEAEGIV